MNNDYNHLLFIGSVEFLICRRCGAVVENTTRVDHDVWHDYTVMIEGMVVELQEKLTPKDVLNSR